MLASFVKVARVAKVAKSCQKLPEVARFSKTMDWGLVQKCDHDMRAGDSSAVMGSKKQCGEGCEWRLEVDGLLIPTL